MLGYNRKYMEIINGKTLATKIEDQITKQVFNYCENIKSGHHLYRRPCLTIIKIGERTDSALYVKIKERQAKSVGIDTNLYLLPENIDDKEVIEAIQFLNIDNTVDGILVQLPLPEHLDTDKIISAIDHFKDVDGFHPKNLANLTSPGILHKIIPPVYASILMCLESIDFKLMGKNTVIIGQSDIFTKQLDSYLASYGAIVTVFKANDDWYQATKQADLIITAVGQANLITKEDLKPEVVIIDIGISQHKGKTVGDIDSASVQYFPGYLTPVPGGIGPMTVALALKNTLDSYIKNNIKTDE